MNTSNMVKSNQHRIGKHAFQIYLTDYEKETVENARKKLGVSTNRELLLRLCELSFITL